MAVYPINNTPKFHLCTSSQYIAYKNNKLKDLLDYSIIIKKLNMKRAKIIMAIACVLFFSALAYTNWTEGHTKKDKKYIETMEEIQETGVDKTSKKEKEIKN